MLMPTRPSVDFHFVERKHAEIHGRLENWALWCCGGSPSSAASPMFRLYRPDNFARDAPVSICDGLDAQRIGKGVSALPEPHRLSLRWCYIRPGSPRKACQMLGTTFEGLALYIRDARQFLINRRV